MSRPRTPDAVAKVTGAALKNAGRFKDRNPPKVAPLGSPPRGFTAGQKTAWAEFADEMPWLGKSDRTVVEVASRLRADMQTNADFPIGGYAQLRMCLSSMGGTPADRSKIGGGSDDDSDDPADEFLN